MGSKTDEDSPNQNTSAKTESVKHAGNCWEKMSSILFSSISNFFGRLGVSAGEKPWQFLIVMLLVAIVMGAGLPLVNREGRPEELWVPSTSEAASDKDTVDKYYAQTSRTETVILESEDGDMLTTANFELMLQAYNKLAATTAQYEGSTLTWSNMCTKVGDDCQAINVLEDFSYTVPATRAQILTQINNIQDGSSRLLQMTYGTQVDAEQVLGGVTKDSNNDITSATAAKLIFKVRNDRQRSSDGGWETPDAEAWEEQWLEVAKNLALNRIIATRFAGRTRSDEFGGAIKADIVMVNVAVVALLVYCSFTLGKVRRGGTRFSLTVLGLLSVGLALISGIGLVNGFGGIPYTPLHGVLAFLLLGLGVDDMFVITHAFDCTDPAEPIVNRISESLQHSGSSVLLTSATDTLAFLIGALTILPALSHFCLTAGVSIFFILVFQCLFFVPCLVLDERRRAAGKNDIFCCCKMCCCESCICSGASPEEQNQDCECGEPTVHPEPATACEPSQGGCIRRLLQRLSRPLIYDTKGNLLGLVLFLGVLALGITGVALLKTDSDSDRFIPPDSYARKYLDTDEEYYSTVGVPTYAYIMNPSYWQRSSEMASLRTEMMNNEYIVSATVNSWAHAFDAQGCAYTTEAEWYTCLDTFLQSAAGSQYRRHVVFEDNGATGSTSNPIVTSRIYANHIYLDTSGKQVDGMDSFRSTVNNFESSLYGSLGSPFGFSVFYPSYEGYKVVEQEAYRNIGLALVAVLLIVFLLIPDASVSSTVFLCIGSTIVEVAGFVHWWGLTIDNVLVLMLIISVGISVDYGAHIAHAYFVSQGAPAERANAALTEKGTCVFHGFFSTFLAIVVLAPSRSYVFTVFFRCLFLASVLGIFNGLLLLPIGLKALGTCQASRYAADSSAVEEQRDQPKACANVAETSTKMEAGVRHDLATGDSFSRDSTKLAIEST